MSEITALTTIPKTGVGRKCTVCLHLRVSEINAEIRRSTSFRDISRQFDVSKDSVFRHTNNCLTLDVSALYEEKRLTEKVEHYKELKFDLEMIRDLQQSAREFLTDPHTGRLSIQMRADDLEFIYLDLNDLDANFAPKRKKTTVKAFLEYAHQLIHGTIPVAINVKGVHPFEAVMEILKASDRVLDKLAKVDGHYQKERENDEQLSRAAEAFEKWLEDNPDRIQSSADRIKWLERFAERAKVDKKRLADRLGISLK